MLSCITIGLVYIFDQAYYAVIGCLQNKKTFIELASEAGLKDATVKLLVETHEVDSVNLLANLKATDFTAFELSLGQRRALEAWHGKADKKTQKTNVLDTPREDETGGEESGLQQTPVTTDVLGRDAGLAAEVQKYINSAEGLNTLLGNNANFNPGHGKKALLINEYVSHSRSSYEDEQRELATDGNTSLFLKATKGSKPKPEDVTLPQWIGANARIHADLIKRGDLVNGTTQLAYCKYVSHIGDLAQANTWSSVMLFDHEFRKLQAKDG